MKGPYLRLKFDLRRVWECPVCHHRERTSGDVTFRYCRCQRSLPPSECQLMRLVHDGESPPVRSHPAPPEPPPPP